MGDEVRVLQDRQDIADLLYGYGYALDGRNWDALRSCFLPNAVGNYGGDPLRGYDAIERLCRDTLEPLSVSQHLISNVTARVDGDRATASCYLHAQHVTPAGEQFVFAGRYIDELVRTPDGWRIAERTLEPMWTSGDPAVVARAR